MTHLVNSDHDTNCFHLAFEEWKIQNECPLADYNDLPLEARSQIMRRANELKFGDKPKPKTLTHDPSNYGQAPMFSNTPFHREAL